MFLSKRFICFLTVLMVLFGWSAVTASTWVALNGITQQPAEPIANVVISNENETVIEFNVSGFLSEMVSHGDIDYNSIKLPGYWTSLEVGKPQVPAIVEMVAIPADADVTVSIVGSTSQVLTGINVCPFQTPLKEDEAPSGFDIDETVYGQSQLYPAEIAGVGTPGLWRDLKVVKLAVYPVQVNPADGELTIHTDLTVRLQYTRSGDAAAVAKPVSETYDRIYRNSIINYEYLDLPLTTRGGTDANYDMLIIAEDSYVDNMTPFTSWKNTKGISTQVVPMSSVGSTVTDVKNYILQEYTNNAISYVLLVGNETDIPGYIGYGFHSDYYYTLLAGSDDYADIAIGRFCVHSETDCNTMVSKSVTFEENPPEGDWLDNTLLVAHAELAPDKYQGCKEEIRTATYNYLAPEFSILYGSSTANGGNEASNADVIAAIDAGQRLVNYRGHGDNDIWWNWNIYGEHFSPTEVAQLNNGTMTPVVLGIACLNANLSYASMTLAEAFTLDAEAAVSYLSASDPSYTDANHTYDKQLYLSIFNDSVKACGDISNIAATRIINEHGTYGLANARMYLWLGDPTLEIIYQELGPIRANFIASPTEGCPPLAVNFTDSSFGDVTSWSWDFGDGVGTSTEQNPSYTYTGAGYYTVTLTVSGPEGTDDHIKVDYIKVYDPPVADFSATPLSGGYPQTVDFTDLTTNDPYEWHWDFGDGDTANVQNPSHTYNAPGLYTVTLTAANGCTSDTETKIDYINITEPPFADLPYSTGFESGSLDQYWKTFSYDEGRILITTANTPRGTYHMTMDDYLDAGLYSLNEAWLRVNLGGLSDVELTFWWKEFGDEDHVEDGVFFSDNGGASFVKVYSLVGGTSTYQQIILDVDQLASSNGLSLTGNFVIKFSQYDNYMIATDGFAFDDISVVSSETPPVADFEASPASGCAPLAVNFTDLSSGNPAIWSWDFGDGGTSSLQNPSYTYDTAGTYTVSLTVTNAYGSDDEVKVDMIVAEDCSVSHALSDITVAGYVSGNYTNTYSSDLVYESIQEEISTGHPVKIWSFLEHKWDFNVTAGNTIDFYVEGYRTDNTEGDNFDFEYSTNGTDFTYILTVNSSVQQTYTAALPSAVSGTVYIRVVDTDQSRGNTAQDYVYIDHMWIVSQGSPPPPDTMYVYSIDVTRTGGKANRYQGQAVVTVYNQNDQPVEGALVSGHFTGPSSDNASGTTGTDGKATILSQSVKGPVGTWCFYVDDVSLGSNVYDPSRNVENYDCEPPAKEIADLLPDHFELGQNHPNPFNPATSILYSLPVASHVTITIYNILGEKVCRLVDRTMEPGYHSVIWNGTDSDGNTVSTGVYFYSMTAGDFSDTRKLLMMK